RAHLGVHLLYSRASYSVERLFQSFLDGDKAAMTKYVYSFGRGKAEGSSVMRNLLGGKGCELAEMTNLGIPVPPGFTITTQAWAAYNRSGGQFPEGMWEQTVL